MFDSKEDATATHLLTGTCQVIFHSSALLKEGVQTPQRLTFEHSQTVPVQNQTFLGLQGCCYRVSNKATPEFPHMPFRCSVAIKVICSYLKLWRRTRRHRLITAPDKSWRGRWSQQDHPHHCHLYSRHKEFFRCTFQTVEPIRMSLFEWQALDLGMQLPEYCDNYRRKTGKI